MTERIAKTKEKSTNPKSWIEADLGKNLAGFQSLIDIQCAKKSYTTKNQRNENDVYNGNR